MRYDTVIWDFNGTLVDDAMLGIVSANRMLEARGLAVISGIEEYRERFFFPVEEYYRSLGFDFEKEPYKDLAAEWFGAYLTGEPTLMPMEEAAEALETVRSAGLRQIILSASESSLLRRQLDRFGFTDYFDEVIGGDNFLAGGKAETARARLGENNHRCAMIGDTSHDFETAVAIGATPYLYCGGHESRERLKATGAVVEDSLIQLCEIICKI